MFLIIMSRSPFVRLASIVSIGGPTSKTWRSTHMRRSAVFTHNVSHKACLWRSNLYGTIILNDAKMIDLYPASFSFYFVCHVSISIRSFWFQAVTVNPCLYSPIYGRTKWNTTLVVLSLATSASTGHSDTGTMCRGFVTSEMSA